MYQIEDVKVGVIVLKTRVKLRLIYQINDYLVKGLCQFDNYLAKESYQIKGYPVNGSSQIEA